MIIPTDIDLKNASLYLRDSGSNFIDIRIGEGNLTYSVGRDLKFLLARGLLDRTREGDEKPCEISFQFIWDHITTGSGEQITLEDAFYRIGAAAAWTTTNLTDPQAPYCLDLQLVYTTPCIEEVQNLYFSMLYYETLSHDMRAATVDFAGKCNSVRPIAYQS